MHRQIQGSCAQCHKPQAWKPATFQHESEGIRNFENCVACHRSAREGNEREGRGEGRKKD